MHSYDVAIIGGGLVGASMARSLSGSGLRTIVLDQQLATDLYSAKLDNRGLALSYGSKKILAELQIWDTISKYAFPINTVHVSEQGCFGFTRLQADHLQIPTLGYVISASQLGLGLMQNLECLPDITVKRPVEIKGLCYNSLENNWTIALEDCKIQASLLIAADGTDSFLRVRQNLSVTSIEFNQTAIVTNIYSANSLISAAQTAYERFTPKGVLALLPFGDQRYKCIWTVENKFLAEIQQLSDQQYMRCVQNSMGYRVGKFTAIDKRVNFAIRHLQATSLYAEGVVLVGNAANTLHPVAAQGFNLGLRDVYALSRLLRMAKLNQQAVNNQTILAQYADHRQQDHNQTQDCTNSLVRIFASGKQSVKSTRRLGLLAAHFIRPINNTIAARGAGIWTS